jgi:quercetin dioxygenase-like cupin family protein
MDELEKGLKITLSGPVHNKALEKFHEQLEQWGVVMPPVEPLVLDFGLGDFWSTGLIEYWIANEVEAGYCGKYLFVFDHQTCPRHKHAVKHETFFIVKGKVNITTTERDMLMKEGDVLPVPPGQLHSFTGIGPALLLELSQPCHIDDNYFQNTDIPIGGNYKKKGNL